jgi:hypothetical protein
MDLGSTGDSSAYYAMTLIMPSSCSRTVSPSTSSFWDSFVSPALLKSFSLDLEEIIIVHFDVEGNSMKKVKRVIHNTSIV